MSYDMTMSWQKKAMKRWQGCQKISQSTKRVTIWFLKAQNTLSPMFYQPNPLKFHHIWPVGTFGRLSTVHTESTEHYICAVISRVITIINDKQAGIQTGPRPCLPEVHWYKSRRCWSWCRPIMKCPHPINHIVPASFQQIVTDTTFVSCKSCNILINHVLGDNSAWSGWHRSPLFSDIIFLPGIWFANFTILNLSLKNRVEVDLQTWGPRASGWKRKLW